MLVHSPADIRRNKSKRIYFYRDDGSGIHPHRGAHPGDYAIFIFVEFSLRVGPPCVGKPDFRNWIKIHQSKKRKAIRIVGLKLQKSQISWSQDSLRLYSREHNGRNKKNQEGSSSKVF